MPVIQLFVQHRAVLCTTVYTILFLLIYFMDNSCFANPDLLQVYVFDALKNKKPDCISPVLSLSLL